MKRILVFAFAIVMLLVHVVHAQNEEEIISKILSSMQQGNFDHTLSLLEKHEEMFSQSEEYYWLWSTVHILNMDMDLAITQAERAFAMKEYPKALDYRRFGIILNEAGRVDDAVNMFQEAVRQNPEDFLSLYNLGIIFSERYMKDPRNDSLKEWSHLYWGKVEAIIEDDPDADIPTISLYFLAEMHADKGNADRAAYYFEQFLLRHESQSIQESEFIMRAFAYVRSYHSESRP